MKGSLIIVGFFILGILAGLFGHISIDNVGIDISFVALCLLMFFVGISIGNDVDALKNLRQIKPGLMFLPLMTITGTLVGCAVISIFMSDRSLTDCLAVGSGFG